VWAIAGILVLLCVLLIAFALQPKHRDDTLESMQGYKAISLRSDPLLLVSKMLWTCPVVAVGCFSIVMVILTVHTLTAVLAILVGITGLACLWYGLGVIVSCIYRLFWPDILEVYSTGLTLKSLGKSHSIERSQISTVDIRPSMFKVFQDLVVLKLKTTSRPVGFRVANTAAFGLVVVLPNYWITPSGSRDGTSVKQAIAAIWNLSGNAPP